MHYSISEMKQSSKNVTFVFLGFLSREKHLCAYKPPLMVILITSGFLLSHSPCAAWCPTLFKHNTLTVDPILASLRQPNVEEKTV